MAGVMLRLLMLGALLHVTISSAVPTTDAFVVRFSIALDKLVIGIPPGAVPYAVIAVTEDTTSSVSTPAPTVAATTTTTTTTPTTTSTNSPTTSTTSSTSTSATSTLSSNTNITTGPSNTTSTIATGTTSPTLSTATHSSVQPIQSSTLASSSSTTTHTPTSTTTTPAVTTESTMPIIRNISVALQPMLVYAFMDTDAFASLQIDFTSFTFRGNQVNVSFSVFYVKSALFNRGLLTPNSAFVDQLRNIVLNISGTPSSVSFGGYIIDTNKTLFLVTQGIDELNAKLANSAWVCSGIQCAANETCYQNRTSTGGTPPRALCVDTCQLFLSNSSCASQPSAPGVYLAGKCALNQFNEPYCDCGMSDGDVMHNFYDGTQCVSVTFIVAMATCAGGLFFVLLLVAMCALCRKKKALKKAKASAKKYQPSPVQQSAYSGYAGINNYAFEVSNNRSAEAVRPDSGNFTKRPASEPTPAPDYDTTTDQEGFASIRM